MHLRTAGVFLTDLIICTTYCYFLDKCQVFCLIICEDRSKRAGRKNGRVMTLRPPAHHRRRRRTGWRRSGKLFRAWRFWGTSFRWAWPAISAPGALGSATPAGPKEYKEKIKKCFCLKTASGRSIFYHGQDKVLRIFSSILFDKVSYRAASSSVKPEKQISR